MRKTKEVLRLYFDSGLKQRAISRCLNLSRTTISDYLSRAAKAGLSWPLPETLTDRELERRLFPAVVTIPSELLVPDWSDVHT